MFSRIRAKIYNLLRFSEKYTKTDMVYLAKGSFWLTLGQIISSASFFLLAIAFANLLSKETYGIYRYVLSIVGILNISTLSGMNTAVAQAVARKFEGSVISALKMKIRWGTLGSAASLFFAGYYYFQVNIELTISFLIVSAFLPFMDSFTLYDSLLSGKKLFRISTNYGTISQLISAIILISALFLTNNLFLILLSYFLPWTITRFVFLKITLKKFPPNLDEDPKTISYGKHLSFVGIIGTVASYLDRLLIFHYLGAAEVAIYSIATAPPDQIKNLFKNIPTLAMPKLAQRSFREIDSILYKRLFYLFMTGLALAGIYSIIAPYFFKLFFPKYMDSVFYSQFFSFTLALKLPISLISVVTQSKITFISKRLLYWANTIPSVVLIISLYLLTKPLGVNGVIVSRIMLLIGSLAATFYIVKNIKAQKTSSPI